MKKNLKDNYVAPEIFPVELVSESLICQSDISNLTGDREDYGTPEILIW